MNSASTNAVNPIVRFPRHPTHTIERPGCGEDPQRSEYNSRLDWYAARRRYLNNERDRGHACLPNDQLTPDDWVKVGNWGSSTETDAERVNLFETPACRN